MKIKEHEKFIAFVLLATALMALAVMIYVKPLPDSTANSGVLQILNMIIGAFIGAFGGAANKLFDAKVPNSVTIDNSPSTPVPVAEVPDTTGELPENEKIA